MQHEITNTPRDILDMAPENLSPFLLQCQKFPSTESFLSVYIPKKKKKNCYPLIKKQKTSHNAIFPSSYHFSAPLYSELIKKQKITIFPIYNSLFPLKLSLVGVCPPPPTPLHQNLLSSRSPVTS